MDLDFTAFIQVGIFLTLVVLLNAMLFKPFLRVLEQRFQQLQGARDEVATLERDASEDLEAYFERLKKARRKAQKEREQLVSSGREKERRMLAETRAEIAQSLNQARTDVASAEEQARKNLDAETDALACRLVEKVLGRKVAS